MPNANQALTVGAILEIAIILVAMYAALSWVISAVHERIAEFLKLRGAKLYEGVLNLVSGHDDLAQKIFDHPLITASSDDRTRIGKPWDKIASTLSLKVATDTGDVPKNGADVARRYRPSYIDARTFSMAFWSKIAALPGSTVTGTSSLASDAAAALKLPTALLDSTRSALNLLESSHPDLYASCTSLLTAAQGDYERLLRVTDSWFDGQMDRVSGWYTRQSQWIVAILALLLVTFAGIDTQQIATKLYSDPVLRTALADKIDRTLGTGANSDCTATSGKTPTLDQQRQALACKLKDELNIKPAEWFNPSWNPFTTWSEHGRGMLLTFAALAVGGPFWFDLLLKLVNVRAAGRKPNRDDQPPK